MRSDRLLILHVLSSNVQEGEKLPTIRETARTLRINPNTVFKIYRRLQADGLIGLRQGSGAYVRASWRDDPPLNTELTTFIRAVFHGANKKFRLTPQDLVQLLYRYGARPGQAFHTCIVVNDDETMNIDATILSRHFASRFVPTDINDLESPTGGLKQMVCRANVFITTMYHIERLTAIARKYNKPVIESRRDPAFENDIQEASTRGLVAVIFARRATREYFRELVFKKLYPKAVGNLLFLSLNQRRRLRNVMKRKCIIFVSPLVAERVRKMAPPQKHIQEISGWISADSIEHVKTMLGTVA